MIRNKKNFWIGLSLINLCVVAFLGFTLRTKFLFPVPFIDYRNVLSAHSHFAFAGWVGLGLMTLLIYNLLPKHFFERKIYQWILAGIEVSAVGMALSFPVKGYWAPSIFFSTLYIAVSYWFGWVFIKDLGRSSLLGTVKLLSVCSVISLLISSVGPFTLSYIMISHSGDSILYRDAIYTFLHFQYNGFFTLAVFALFFDHLLKKGLPVSSGAKWFSIFLCLSVIPALFLSLLWHNSSLYYILAAAGCLFIVLSVFFFSRFFPSLNKGQLFAVPLARGIGLIAFLSFALKMLLNAGTIIPQLGNAVYGDRPVIIGFLHLVFLAFVSFFILGMLIESGNFFRNGKLLRTPFYIFSFGVLANEIVLMLQGLEILFMSNNYIYSWLLWIISILLFIGALSIAAAWYLCNNKKAMARPMA